MPAEPAGDNSINKSTLTVDTGKIMERLAAEDAASNEPEGTVAPAPEAPQEEPAPTPDASTAETPATPGDKPAAAPPVDKTRQIVWNGQIVDVPESQLVSLAQQGFDYTKKTMALSQRAKELEDIWEREIRPKQQQLLDLQKRQQEEEESDPSVRAERKTARLESELTQVRQALVADHQKRAQQELLSQMQSEVASAKKSHDVFTKLTEPEANSLSEQLIWTKIANGMSPKDAVNSTANGLKKLIVPAKSDYVKQKAADMRRAPAPKPGAPPSTRAVTLKGADLHNGKVASAALERFKQMELE